MRRAGALPPRRREDCSSAGRCGVRDPPGRLSADHGIATQAGASFVTIESFELDDTQKRDVERVTGVLHRRDRCLVSGPSWAEAG